MIELKYALEIIVGAGISGSAWPVCLRRAELRFCVPIDFETPRFGF
jgi:hypothetical protein